MGQYYKVNETGFKQNLNIYATNRPIGMNFIRKLGIIY